MMTKFAPRNSDEAAQFLLSEHKQGDTGWYRECLILQRTARGIPAVFPSAYAAAVGTPESERVYLEDHFRRGMVGFSKGTDSAGHIFYIAGRDHNGTVMAWTNDKRHGMVDLVPMSFFEDVWHHKILFAATYLNGYDFRDFNKPPKPVHATLGKNFDAGIQSLEKALEYHKRHNHDSLVALLTKDIKRMKKQLERHS